MGLLDANMAVKQKIDYWISGISNVDLANAIKRRRKPNDSLEEVKAIVKDEWYFLKNTFASGTSGIQINTVNKFCSICRKYNHSTDEHMWKPPRARNESEYRERRTDRRDTPRNWRKNERKEMICYNCDGIGHRAFECRSPQRRSDRKRSYDDYKKTVKFTEEDRKGAGKEALKVEGEIDLNIDIDSAEIVREERN